MFATLAREWSTSAALAKLSRWEPSDADLPHCTARPACPSARCIGGAAAHRHGADRGGRTDPDPCRWLAEDHAHGPVRAVREPDRRLRARGGRGIRPGVD